MPPNRILFTQYERDTENDTGRAGMGEQDTHPRCARHTVNGPYSRPSGLNTCFGVTSGWAVTRRELSAEPLLGPITVTRDMWLDWEQGPLYYLPMRSRVAACIVGSLLATSTVACASTIFADDAALADTPTNVPPIGPKPVIIPEGVAVGMLIHKTIPKYPGKAKAARISGIVTLQATISKTGDISHLHVECGPEMLQEPSLTAVREWKYKPYLLRGEPVEVQTTIRVTFTLGDKKKLPFSKDSCPVE
jgi:TonB family protein